MNTPELSFRSFIVKIWWEEGDQEKGLCWKGYVTDVTSGDRRYIRDLDEIGVFVRRQLENMGVKFGLTGQLAHFWNQL